MHYVFCSGETAYESFITELWRKKMSKDGEFYEAATKENIKTITRNDTIVLWKAWWHHNWSKNAVLKFLTATSPYDVLCHDGKIGEKYRKELLQESKGDKTTRYDFLDLSSDKI
jgi:hypothetical protein